MAEETRDELIDRLLAENGHGKDDVLGKDGLLGDLTKRLLERALSAELSEHVGYDKGDPAGSGSENSRNGTTPKTVHTDTGSVDIQVPRDRNGSFEPQIVKKGQSRLEGLSERVLSMYAGGMTVRDIRDQLADIYGVDVSPDTISRITNEINEEVKAWRSRPLDPVYPIVYLDAIVCKVRHEGTVVNKSAYLAVGIDVDGFKHVLGIWVDTSEGAKFWTRGCNELRNRGVADVLVVVCDGLKGLPEAIESVWPAARVQTCIVHLMRESLNLCSYKDRKHVAADLKTIYRASSEEAAEHALEHVEQKWGSRYPGIIQKWYNAWERVTPFLQFPPEIRRVIYTTNTIESINSQLRKATRNRGHFPNDDALIKVLYLAVRRMESKGRRGMGVSATDRWKQALNQFHTFFPGRLDATGKTE